MLQLRLLLNTWLLLRGFLVIQNDCVSGFILHSEAKGFVTRSADAQQVSNPNHKFEHPRPLLSVRLACQVTEEESSTDPLPTKKSPGQPKDNKAMSFLRKIGRVGASTSADFINAVGVDEGPSGKTTGNRQTNGIRKLQSSYKLCTESGIVDDLSEAFPWTSSGTEWIGVTDRVMGGSSLGSLSREMIDGKAANVLRGNVYLVPGTENGGFIQMATNLGWDPSESFAVDASEYDGIELDVLYQGTSQQEKYNVQYVEIEQGLLIFF
jgi:hypothetical protein